MAYDTREVAGSDERFVYGGHRAKNREFIDSIKSGRDVTTSPFRDCIKTMDVAERILARPPRRSGTEWPANDPAQAGCSQVPVK